MQLTRRPAGATAVIFAMVTGLLVGTPSPAAADGGLGWTTCTAEDAGKPWCEVGAATSGRPGATSTSRPTPSVRRTGGPNRECHDAGGQVVPCFDPVFGSLADDGCYYRPANPSPELQTALGGPGEGPGGWYSFVCPGLGGTGGGTVWRAGAPPGAPGVVTPESLARDARSRLVLPDVTISVSPSGAQLVRLPTWLWIDPQLWHPQTASASVPGIAVTATATPTRVVWSTGDGASVTCTGPGTPWRTGSDPAAASPTCGHVFARSSATAPGGVFTVRATVTWSVTWAGAGQGGALPALTTTAATTVRVNEVQTVVVAP